ncbi:hypothetical protein L227DRAFT_146324 [Lentinus tigrinus ALCF2SS1-6]|uniref:Uncharacterized protein n=1 Tax=Lentinus tigrinus ALCF2SS1-6 TaxID=1328759 RepID=A0A5C2SSS0_9APHY|nr:hypothetical protein L227DRAFT_146324 [Lentinus tigrinus ALCF2SS1-6]
MSLYALPLLFVRMLSLFLPPFPSCTPLSVLVRTTTVLARLLSIVTIIIATFLRCLALLRYPTPRLPSIRSPLTSLSRLRASLLRPTFPDYLLSRAFDIFSPCPLPCLLPSRSFVLLFRRCTFFALRYVICTAPTAPQHGTMNLNGRGLSNVFACICDPHTYAL